MLKLFSKFKAGLQKTSQKLFGALGSIFQSATLDAHSIEDLEAALYGADFGVETTGEIISAIQEKYKHEKSLRGEDASVIGKSVLKNILEGAEPEALKPQETPEVICLVGINGAGKTTTAAKLAHRFSQDKHTVLLGACDTFRAAANEQIQSWSERLGIELVSSQMGADAAAVAFDAYSAAQSREHDILILDTAGRLHNKSNLMQELSKIQRVLKKHDDKAPHHVWLVIDGSLGTNSIEQARAFHEAVGLTGLVITKLDGTSRGGALVAIYRELQVPIYFVGLGEQPDDLQPFQVDHYADAIFGLES